MNTTAKHMTPAEVLADYNKNQRREDERTAAAKVQHNRPGKRARLDALRLRTGRNEAPPPNVRTGRRKGSRHTGKDTSKTTGDGMTAAPLLM